MARTPRGVIGLAALGILLLGLGGLLLTLGRGGSPPRIRFETGQGTAEEIRRATLDEVATGAYAAAVAPGRAGEVAAALATAPIYHVTAYYTPLEEVLASSRVAFVNTSDRPLGDIRFGVLAPAVDARMDVRSVTVDGRARPFRLRGTTLVVDVADSIEPGAEAVVDIEFVLHPRVLEVADAPTEAITGEPDTRITLIFERKGLLILVDWYPRLYALGSDGWMEQPAVPDAVDFSGPAGVVALDLDVPADWKVLAAGHMLEKTSRGGRSRTRHVLPGARALSLTAMPNAVEVNANRGEYGVTGLALSSFVAQAEAAAADTLTAKAALSSYTSPPVWRDTKVGAVALRGPYKSIVVDDLILVEQSQLQSLPSERGPGTAEGGVRTLLFEGAAAEWWGGIRDIDGLDAPGLRDGVRNWAASGVWSVISQNGDARRLATSTGLAPLYREGRDAGTPDTAAATSWAHLDGLLTALAIVTAKAGLMHPALATLVRPPPAPPATAAAEVSDAALAGLAAGDLFTPVGGDDVRDAYVDVAAGFGVGRDAVEAVFTRWYDELHGDEDIGREAGEGTLVAWTDPGAASPFVSANTFPADPSAVPASGRGW
ncbi:MAG: hypothetical protein IT198_06085 [Acidimicrobiia bacterium]|nr:hypothetical protein [Acidimicrobiia bacterium]